MFLMGIFSPKVTREWSYDTLTQVSGSLVSAMQHSIVKDRMDIVVDRMNKGRTFGTPLDIVKYVYVHRKFEELNKYNEKKRKKEFNLDERDEVTGRLPVMTVAVSEITNTISQQSNEIILSWETMRRGVSLDAIDFNDELVSMTKRFNEFLVYYYESYATDLKRLLYLVTKGVVASKKHLDTILTAEQSGDFAEVLGFLINYVEFYEYLENESEVFLIV